MEKMDKLLKIIEDELHRKAESGLTTSNIDTVYKLVDMYKDLKNTEYWDQKAEYYMAVLDEMQDGEYNASGGYGENRAGRAQTDGYGARGRQRRDSRGRYARNNGSSSYRRGSSYGDGDYDGNDTAYSRYMDSKQSYRANKNGECKQRVMSNLEEYMEEFTDQLEEMMRDADCSEERDTIKHYISKFKNMI